MKRILFNLLFPPNCLVCNEPTSSKLCSTCWLLSSLPDPISRCRHCFKELTRKNDLCLDCRLHPPPAPRAHVFDQMSPAASLPSDLDLSPFALCLLAQLDWPDPILLIPMPDSASLSFASKLSYYTSVPTSRALTLSLDYRPDHLEEGHILYLLSAQSSLSSLLQASESLMNALPSKIFILSLSEPV